MHRASRSVTAAIAIAILALVAGCSDTDPSASDGGSGDGGMGDSGMGDSGSGDSGSYADSVVRDGGGSTKTPGCDRACASGEVCLAGRCQAAGPRKTCGSARYPAGLPTNATVLYVDGAYKGTSKGTKTEPYRTIGAALAAAPSGARVAVAVAAGSYAEALTIGSSTGSGAPPTSVEIHCRCPKMVQITKPAEIKPGDTATTLSVTIDGCTISPAGFDPDKATDWSGCRDGSPYGIHATGGAIPFHVRLRDSVVAGWCTGVYYSSQPGGVGSGSLCIARSRVGANATGLDVQRAGLLKTTVPFSECSALDENVGLRLSRFDHNRDYGVFARSNARGVALEANLIERSGQLASRQGGTGYGVYLGDIDSATIVANLVRDNNDRGIGLRNEQATVNMGISIKNNVVSGNGVAGIALQKMQAKRGISVTGNVIRATRTGSGGPGGDGIQISLDQGAHYSVAIKNNRIVDNARSGVFYDGVGGTIDGNAISGSKGYGIFLQRTGSAVTVGTNQLSGNVKGQRFTTASPVLKYGVMPVPPP